MWRRDFLFLEATWDQKDTTLEKTSAIEDLPWAIMQKESLLYEYVDWISAQIIDKGFLQDNAHKWNE